MAVTVAAALYPTPWTVGVAVFAGAVDDGFGNVTAAWADPVDAAVYGWAPAGTAEPDLSGRDEVTWDLDLYAPPGFPATPADRVWVGGVEFTAVGVAEAFNSGPFGFAPGVRLRLRRIEG